MSLRTFLIAGAAAAALSVPTGAAAQSMSTVISDLNLRAGPGSGHARIVVMPAGVPVSLHHCSGGWCQVTYAGYTGWASQRYLSISVAVAPQPTPGWTAGPVGGFEFHAGALPPSYWDDDRELYWDDYWDDWSRPGWYAGWDDPVWWDDRPLGWYGPVYWDRSNWWHAGQWYSSPGFAIHIGAR